MHGKKFQTMPADNLRIELDHLVEELLVHNIDTGLDYATILEAIDARTHLSLMYFFNKNKG